MGGTTAEGGPWTPAEHRRVHELEALAASLQGLAARGAAWLLRWEPTDLYAHIFDTSNLSVIRGGSAMLDAVVRRAASLPPVAPLAPVPIFAAASQALLAVEGHERDVRKAAEGLADLLASDPWRAPSSWAIRPLDPRRPVRDLLADTAREIALGRLRRLEVDPGGRAGEDADELDMTRPVDPEDTACRVHGTSIEAGRLNVANAHRFRFGQQMRLGLLEPVLGCWRAAASRPGREPSRPVPYEDLERVARGARKLHTGAFAQDFASLGEASRLGGYIGVVAVDGTGFGAWRGEARDLADLGWRSFLLEATLHRVLAEALDEELRALDAALAGSGEVPQLAHILLMAGDDILLVVRGHRAFDVARSLLKGFPDVARHLAEAFPANHPARAAAEALATRSLRAGVVVADAATPIRHLQEAAVDLRDRSARERARREGGPRPALDWAVLKSHDVPPRGILAERRAVLGGSGTTRPHSLEGFERLWGLALGLGLAAPTTQVRRRALAAARGRPLPPLGEEAEETIRQVGEPGEWLVDEAPPGAWVDLDELLDVAVVA